MLRLGTMTLMALWLSACVSTTYRAYDEPVVNRSPFSRDVRYDLADDFHRDPPDCAIVLPVQAGASADFADTVEHAVARHLGGKLSRVIGPAMRRQAERDLVLDFTDPGDRARFARQKNCRHVLRIRHAVATDTYAVIWSDRSLTIDLSLQRVRDGAIVWRAAHTASRGDGGLPLSPIGLGGAALRAGLSHGDTGIFPSLLDDAMRRMFATLPDTRW